MRRFVPLLIAGVLLLAAACSDSIAPTPSASGSVLELSRNGLAAAKKKKQPPAGTVYTEQFFIPAAGGTVHVGEFTLNFPSNSVCNPLTSGYGKKSWDKPCETLAVDFAITAKYWVENGESFVEFSPDIRFDPSKTVMISTNRPELIGKNGIGEYKLFYWTRNLHGKQKHDEGSYDQTLRTQFNPETGDVFRRIKHFSGISISSGWGCDDTVGDPDCASDGGGFQY
jgi:hypothetical protein